METKNIYQKIAAVQSKLQAIKKDEVNPHFKSKFFNINAVAAELRPLCAKEGLAVIQPIVYRDGKSYMETTIVDADTKESLAYPFQLQEFTDIQKFGAYLTYMRRYSLVSLFLIEGEEDDDGNSAVGLPVPAKTAAKGCEDCGAPLNPNYPKSTKCYPCFIKAPKTPPPPPPVAKDDIPF